MKEQSPTHKPSLADRWRLRRVLRQIYNAEDYLRILDGDVHSRRHEASPSMQRLLQRERGMVNYALTNLYRRRDELKRRHAVGRPA